jgi:hypothetical protein
MIPERTKASIDRYVKDHMPTGDFLYAVLTNNLTESIGRADDENGAALKEIVQYIYNEIPWGCWGSPERVKRWLCPHDSSRQKVINIGNCYNRYICPDCGYDRTIDSSD